MLRLAFYVTTLNSWILSGSQAFYLPTVVPQSFEEGDVVELKINKMTSAQTLMPVDYYRFPFCQPVGGPKLDNENLGELLAGDAIESSPYRLRMMEEMYCQQVCFSNLGLAETTNVRANKVAKAIHLDYHNNWIVDNLPAASKAEDDATVTTRYWQGFPVGFIAEDDHKAYVNNHVNLEIMYHPAEGQEKKYRIVRFTVQPFSIKYDFVPVDNGTTDEDWAVIKNPISSCNRAIPISERRHTSYDMVASLGQSPQPASGKVLFTYDVLWIRNDDVQWASRWDIYLSMDGAVPQQVHWLFIAYGAVFVCALSAVVITIMIRNLRQDLARYNQLPTNEDKADELEEKGWKLLHADVFRPPCFSPLLLSVCCGTGAQLLCVSFWIIVLSALGIVSEAKRGSLRMAGLILYALMGAVSGYVTARLYKTFNGMEWEKATICTAAGFPGLFSTLFVVIDMLAWSSGSTYAVSVEIILVLLALWLGILLPFVFLGAHFGYKQEALEFPVQTSSTPRQIPNQSWFMTPLTLLFAGILPFGACYMELYFILASVWVDYYYNVFGFLLLVFIILIVTSAEITVLINYYQLCNEDYHWWWRSFTTAGSTSIYIFVYSFEFFREMEAHSFGTCVLYFGYMGLACLGLFLMIGFVGVMANLWFNMKIFGSLKVT